MAQLIYEFCHDQVHHKSGSVVIQREAWGLKFLILIYIILSVSHNQTCSLVTHSYDRFENLLPHIGCLSSVAKKDLVLFATKLLPDNIIDSWFCLVMKI